jgi:predicted HTH domain antitoxin
MARLFLESHQAERITLRQAADTCNMSLWEIVQEAKQRHIHASYRMEDLEKDLATAHGWSDI